MATTSGIKTVTAIIDGQTYTLTLNSDTGKYEATVQAPSKSSWNKEGHYYPVEIKATDNAGNSATANDKSPTIGEHLKLKVKEKVAPTVTDITPTSGAYLATSVPKITAALKDADSGVDTASLVLKIDNTPVDNSKITKNPTDGGYKIEYTVEKALNDGQHTVSIEVADNDGNKCAPATSTFNVMATAPALTINKPADGLKTKESALTVEGTTNTDATITIKLNGSDQGSVTVDKMSGAFTKALTLAVEGDNEIEIVATNPAGVKTTVKRTVIYDITAPTISAVAITPNPVDAGKTYTISVTVTD